MTAAWNLKDLGYTSLLPNTNGRLVLSNWLEEAIQTPCRIQNSHQLPKEDSFLNLLDINLQVFVDDAFCLFAQYLLENTNGGLVATLNHF